MGDVISTHLDEGKREMITGYCGIMRDDGRSLQTKSLDIVKIVKLKDGNRQGFNMSAKFYRVTTENYHKAADELNAKFRRYEIKPICADLQGQILKCYRENTGQTLSCSRIASLYLQCVNDAKQNKMRTGG